MKNICFGEWQEEGVRSIVGLVRVREREELKEGREAAMEGGKT